MRSRTCACLLSPRYTGLFFKHNFKTWVGQKKFDTRSIVDEAPGFVDAEGGQWALTADSNLKGLGFQPLGIPDC